MKQLKDRYDLNNKMESDIDGYGMKGSDKELDLNSLKFADIDHRDAPDYVDAFIEQATWTDGTPLTDDELDNLNEDTQFVYEMLQEHLH